MTTKILITYASRAGSTQGIAEAIAQTLASSGLNVDIFPMRELNSLAMYDAVVAGSAIRFDRWLPEAMQFVEQHQAVLSQKPFAPFLVCMAMAVQNEARREQAIATASAYLNPVRELVPTISEGLFAGVLDLSKLPLIYRIPFGVVTLTGFFEEGDYRDWDAIEQWATQLSTQLVTQPQSA